jgi:hypothetical protein
MLNFEWLQGQQYETAPLPPHPPLQAALFPSVWQNNLHPFGRELYLYGKAVIPKLKSKGKTSMVEEPSHAKQLSLNHVRKIGLKPMTQISQPFDYEHSNLPLLC